jgi:F-box/leucine-rich repeat protein 10/11
MIFEVSEREALGIIMPTSDGDRQKKFDPSDVARLAGPKRKLSVLSVAKQTGLRMSLEQWAEYWNSSEQRANKGILNLITLECSGTALASRLRSPAFVRGVDWIDKIWPKRESEKEITPSTTSTTNGGEAAVGYKQKAGQKFRNSKGTGSTTHPKVQMVRPIPSPNVF